MGRPLDEDVLAEYGNQMFGRRIRLRVLLWAQTQHEAFNQSEAAVGVSYSSSGEVAKELERLVRLGMLRKFGRPSRVGPQNYLRVEHPGWAIATAARAAVEKGLPELGESGPDRARGKGPPRRVWATSGATARSDAGGATRGRRWRCRPRRSSPPWREPRAARPATALGLTGSLFELGSKDLSRMSRAVPTIPRCILSRPQMSTIFEPTAFLPHSWLRLWMPSSGRHSTDWCCPGMPRPILG